MRGRHLHGTAIFDGDVRITEDAKHANPKWKNSFQLVHDPCDIPLAPGMRMSKVELYFHLRNWSLVTGTILECNGNLYKVTVNFRKHQQLTYIGRRDDTGTQ